jgi:membrane protein required for colicin V production
MNQVDFFIIVVVGLSAVSGARRGMIAAAGDILSLLLGLIIGSLAYPPVAAALQAVFGLGDAVAGALGFIVLAVLTVFLAGWGSSLLAQRFRLSKPANRLGGAGFGGFFGILLAAVLVLASGILPGAARPVSASALGPRITALVPRLHENMDAIGVPLPKLVYLPTDYRDEVLGLNRGLQFLQINFSRLDGATCIHCRSPVQFTGYHFSRGTLISPRFHCPNCGRTSDGCQTFEGFHAIYGACPVPLAQEGLRFDCGVWTNRWWTVPHGPCPVCGKEYRSEEEDLAVPGAVAAPPAISPER